MEARGSAGHETTACGRVGEAVAAIAWEQVERFNDDPAWRGERIRYVIAAREVIIEINRMLYEGLADRRASLDDVLDENDIEKTRRFFNSMPSFDVSVSMKTAYHRNPAHRWKPNHIHDIDALASTIP